LSGPPRFLEGDGPDLPLCVAPWMARTTRTFDLRIGDTLLLYTDGLIEVPGTDLTEGMEHLAAQAQEAAAEGMTLASLCARLLAAASDRRDDAAIIGFRPIAQGRVHSSGHWV
jgi:serine phosphatase RsbU (regulator of sigma subunit)